LRSELLPESPLALRLYRGLDIQFTKILLIYTIAFHILVWGLGALFGGDTPNKATLWRWEWLKVLFLGLEFYVGGRDEQRHIFQTPLYFCSTL